MNPDSAGLLLKRVAAVYAAAQTYQDRGTVSRTMHTAEHTLSRQQSFITAYSRIDGRFRFEFTVPWPMPVPGMADRRQIIFRDGIRLEHWATTGRETTTPTSLERLVAGATGISGGAAYNIPSLLIPELGG
ncbi:MAG TPA: hypothetical protein VMB48_11510, partial [Steroidobacteraceae bacterium]|nr:hypothetical protein [Steroidobacteraceae bacterium]